MSSTLPDRDDRMRPEGGRAGAAEEGGLGISLADIVGTLRKRWRLIALLSVLGAIAGFGISQTLPNRYEGIAVIQIDSRKRAIVNFESVVSDLRTDNSIVDGEVDIIRSRAVALRVIEAEKLRSDPEFNEPGLLDGIWPFSPKSKPKDSDGPDEVLNGFLGNVRAARMRMTPNLEIRFYSRDAAKAARIANAIADAYLAEQVSDKVRTTSTARDLLEQKLEGLRQRVTEAERQVADFKAENKLFDTEGQMLSEKQLIRVMEQVLAAENSVAETKARYEQVKRTARSGEQRTAVADIIQNGTIRLLKEQLARVTRMEAELLTRYGPKHPAIIKVRAEVQDTQSQIAAEVDQILANMTTEYQVSQEREKALRKTLEALQEQQVIAKEASVRLKELQREAETSRQLYESFLGRYKQTAETQSMQLADGRIIERADTPTSPISPKRRMIQLGGLAGGFALGFGLALLLELWTPGFRRPDDVEKALDIDTLTPVPQASGPGQVPIDPMRAARLMVAEPRGAFAEAIRSVRHEVDSRRRGREARVLLVASTLPNEGKSTIASNLAHHYALTGGRTLLIDADLRTGSLTRQLLNGYRFGLRDCLLRRQPLTSAILQDRSTNLSFLPAFDASAARVSAPELLSTYDCAYAIAELKQHFDTIIIDSPPVLPVVDTRILADYADQILYVMAWRRTPQVLARRAMRSLAINSRKVSGIIMNQVEQADVATSFGYGADRAEKLAPSRTRAA